MLSTDKGSAGPQYLIGSDAFLWWLRKVRPLHYAQYKEHQETGQYASWLCYLWCDGDKAQERGAMRNCRVPVADRRIYFRTAVKAIIANVPFDEYEESFEEDTSSLPLPCEHNGEAKLSALLACVSAIHPVVYIGSGKHRPEQGIFKRKVEMECVDPFEATPGILETYPIHKGKTYLLDAYYSGFEVHQRRYEEADLYYAKQMPVANSDFLFVLPGSYEARYTNDRRFSGFFLDLLAQFTRAPDRDSAVYACLERINDIHRDLILFSKGGAMGVQEVIEEIIRPTTITVPFREYALYIKGDHFSVDDKCFSKTSEMTRCAREGLSDAFRESVKVLLERYDKHVSEKQLLGRRRKKGREPKRDAIVLTEDEKRLIGLVDIAMLRGVNLPVLPFDPTNVKRVFMDMSISEISDHSLLQVRQPGGEFLSDIDVLRKNCRLFDWGCGTGLYTAPLNNVDVWDRVDRRIDKRHPFVKHSDARWVLFRHVLHHVRNWGDLLNRFKHKNIIIIEHDPRYGTRELDTIHAYWKMKGHESEYTNYIPTNELPADFVVHSVLGKYGSYLAYRLAG